MIERGLCRPQARTAGAPGEAFVAAANDRSGSLQAPSRRSGWIAGSGGARLAQNVECADPDGDAVSRCNRAGAQAAAQGKGPSPAKGTPGPAKEIPIVNALLPAALGQRYWGITGLSASPPAAPAIHWGLRQAIWGVTGSRPGPPLKTLYTFDPFNPASLELRLPFLPPLSLDAGDAAKLRCYQVSPGLGVTFTDANGESVYAVFGQGGPDGTLTLSRQAKPRGNAI
jgi:hypothetical protein